MVVMNEQRRKQPCYHALDIAEFKDQCRELIADVAERGGSVIVLCEDKPVAELIRYVPPPLSGYGSLKGKVEILGDIEGPMPVEWYTDPAVQTDDEWDISGPMPASWFIDSHEGELRESHKPEKVDVSTLHRHKFITVNISEFVAQLDEIITAVSESKDGKVAIFDDEKGLVELGRYEQMPSVGRQHIVGEEEVR